MFTIMRKFKLLISFPFEIWKMFVTYCPGEIGYILRRRFWKKRLKHLGRDVKIDIGIYFQNPSYIVIDDNTWIDRNVVIMAGLDVSNREKITKKNSLYKGEPGVVYIGRNCHIGIGCILSGISTGIHISDNCGIAAHGKLYSFSHHYRSKKDPNRFILTTPMASDEKQCLIEGAIYFGSNVGLASNCTILPGVALEDNVGVLPGSVVFLGRYPAGILVSGNPAKKIGFRIKAMMRSSK